MLYLRKWREWCAMVPGDCPGCGRRVPGQGLCAACTAGLYAGAGKPSCPRCAHPLYGDGACHACHHEHPAYGRVLAAFHYQGLGQQLVHDYKLRCHLGLAGLLAGLLEDAVRRAGPAPAGPPHWLVPVPARRSALLQRGFSPPAELARLLAPRLGLKYSLDLVQRVHEGARQSTLGFHERMLAQEGVYACVRKRGLFARSDTGKYSLAGKRIAIVDDVFTTGATMQSLAKALRHAGAAHVEAWVLARTIQAAGL